MPVSFADLCRAAVRHGQLPCLAAAEVRLGEHPVYHAEGLARPGRAADERTLFPIASVTKTMTAALCARRVAEGLWRWDQTVRSIWPGFRLADADATARLTLRDALCHRSGLPPHTWAWVFAPAGRIAFLRDRLPHLAAAGKFDEKVRYSNLMYALAGGLLELQDKTPWEEQVRRLIWHALGMDSTRHAEADWFTRFPGVAEPRGPHGPVPPFHAERNHVIAPASEVFSTARDLSAWLSHLMSEPDLAPCFAPSSEVTATRPHALLGKLHYGLGWRVEHLDGSPLVWHSGQCTGYTAWIGFQPERRRGWVLLCNRDGAIDSLQALSCALATGDVRWFERLPAPAVPAFSAPEALKPVRLAPPGVYLHPGYGEVEISAEGRLRLNASAFGETGADARGELKWEIPGYGKRVDASFRETEVRLDLEPALPPVAFRRRD